MFTLKKSYYLNQKGIKFFYFCSWATHIFFKRKKQIENMFKRIKKYPIFLFSYKIQVISFNGLANAIVKDSKLSGVNNGN